VNATNMVYNSLVNAVGYMLGRGWLFLAGIVALTADALAEPFVVKDYAPWLAITACMPGAGAVTQMAWGPKGRLYAARSTGGAVSFSYNAVRGELCDMKAASDISGLGIGFVPGRGEMYLGTTDSIWRLTDTNGDGHWGTGPGEIKIPIVTGIPTGFHSTDQIQIQGNTLYTGIGTRTSDGGTNTWPDAPEGESAYGGTICWIRDLSLVPSKPEAARVLGPLTPGTIQGDATPYDSAAKNKLVVYCAGARNPFGLALDRDGQLYFTNNYNRAETHGDGTSSASGPGDAPGRDLSHSVHDQFFRAVLDGDYGFRNDNWRGVRDPKVVSHVLDPSVLGHVTLRSITPDNLRTTDPNYLQLYDPEHPIGLGPSSSADGFAFWYSPRMPATLCGCAFIARWNAQISESSPGSRSIRYADLVAVDPYSGTVRRVAAGFVHPLAVLADSRDHLLVADWGAGTIYTLTAHR
jgi:hypothetical protein